MTIDITIGKLTIKSWETVLAEKLEDRVFTGEDTISSVDFLEVNQCPEKEDGCTLEDTAFPNSAYRSGGIGSMSNFFTKVMSVLIEKIRPYHNNDLQISRIKPFIEEIMRLKYSGTNDLDKKRLHWFKFWCSRAVELYGEDAVIKFK